MIIASIAVHASGAGPADPRCTRPTASSRSRSPLVMWVVTIVVLAIAVRETNRTLDERRCRSWA